MAKARTGDYLPLRGNPWSSKREMMEERVREWLEGSGITATRADQPSQPG